MQIKREPFSRLILVTLASFVMLGLAFAVYVWSERQTDHAYEQRERSFLLADELRRSYVVTTDPVYIEHYQSILDIRDGRKPRPNGYRGIYWDLVVADGHPPPVPEQPAIALLELMRQAGFTEQEFDKLREAKAVSDMLSVTELTAMKLAQSSGPTAAQDHENARRMLHDPAYQQARASIMRPINEFSRMVDERTFKDVKLAKTFALIVRLVFIAFALGLLFALFRVNRFLQATFGGSVDQVYEHLKRIGSGDFSTETAPPADMSDSILGWLAQAQTKGRRNSPGERMPDGCHHQHISRFSY